MNKTVNKIYFGIGMLILSWSILLLYLNFEMTSARKFGFVVGLVTILISKKQLEKYDWTTILIVIMDLIWINLQI